MNNSAYGPPLPPRERRTRWDPTPKHGGPIEKNFYVMHPDVGQRQEVSVVYMVSGLYLEFRLK